VSPADLGDPDFFEENRRALEALSAICNVPVDVYE
jgi:succinylarginine dihydrolase